MYILIGIQIYPHIVESEEKHFSNGTFVEIEDRTRLESEAELVVILRRVGAADGRQVIRRHLHHIKAEVEVSLLTPDFPIERLCRGERSFLGGSAVHIIKRTDKYRVIVQYLNTRLTGLSESRCDQRQPQKGHHYFFHIVVII